MSHSTLRKAFALTAFGWLLLISAEPAFAHSVNKRFGDFYGGMLHPLTALEHLLPLVAVGLLAGQQETRAARSTVLGLLGGLALGAIIGPWLGPQTIVEWLNRGSFVVLGLAVAAAIRVPAPLLVVISFSLGAAHGMENTAAIPASVAMHLFIPGILTAGLAIGVIMAAVAIKLQLPWQQIAVRVIGSWIAAIGILIVGLTM